MASTTKKLKVRRALRIINRGKARKNLIRLHGTTQPNLPLDKPNANEQAQQAKRA